MKNLFFIILIPVILSCQDKQSRNPPITDSSPVNITEQNLFLSYEKYVKHFPKEPIYYMYVDHEQCFFDILVNDIPAYNYFKDGGIMSSVILNNYISRSGKQKITYRLYPQTERERGEGFNELTPYTRFNLTLYSRDNADSATSFDKQVELLEHSNLKKSDGKTFIAAGKNYYEYTIEFDATVPYRNIPNLENAQDLRKIDKKVLEKKTVDAYKYLRDIIIDKKKDEYFSLVFNSDLRYVQSNYYSKAELKETAAEDMSYFNTPSFKLEPIENYVMKIYGDGKLVCLEHTSNDLRLKGKSSLWGKYNAEEGGVRVKFLRILLYMPKDKDTFEIW